MMLSLSRVPRHREGATVSRHQVPWYVAGVLAI